MTSSDDVWWLALLWKSPVACWSKIVDIVILVNGDLVYIEVDTRSVVSYESLKRVSSAQLK